MKRQALYTKGTLTRKEHEAGDDANNGENQLSCLSPVKHLFCRLLHTSEHHSSLVPQ